MTRGDIWGHDLRKFWRKSLRRKQRASRLKVVRTMTALPDVLYRVWTEQFDRWFAAPGSVLMQGEINTAFYFETCELSESLSGTGLICRYRN